MRPFPGMRHRGRAVYLPEPPFSAPLRIALGFKGNYLSASIGVLALWQTDFTIGPIRI